MSLLDTYFHSQKDDDKSIKDYSEANFSKSVHLEQYGQLVSPYQKEGIKLKTYEIWSTECYLTDNNFRSEILKPRRVDAISGKQILPKRP
jgi:hypothetical protein